MGYSNASLVIINVVRCILVLPVSVPKYWTYHISPYHIRELCTYISCLNSPDLA